MCEYLPTPYQQFIHLSRYSRWIPELNRRESWEETINRYFDFFVNHLREKCNYKADKKTVEELKTAVLNLEIMPSMRALMTAGDALEKDNVAHHMCGR